MRTAIIVYSLTGNTRRVADAVAKRLAAEVSVVVAPQVRPGNFSIFRWGMAAWLGLPTPVSLNGPGAAGFDAVVLAAPVWAGRVAVPMRAWLHTGPVLPARIGLVMTGGAASQSARPFADFARFAKATPKAQLYLSEKAMTSGKIDAEVAAFCAALVG